MSRLLAECQSHASTTLTSQAQQKLQGSMGEEARGACCQRHVFTLRTLLCSLYVKTDYGSA